MKKNEFTKSVLTALLLASSSVMADSNYPASDFQPKVVFSDSSAQSASSSTAANSGAKAIEKVEADPNYPAAHYQPKVLFSDTEYKHSQTAPSVSSAKSSSENEPVATEREQTSSSNNLLGLMALVIVGFFLYSKKSAVKISTVDSSQVNSASGVTGVERYLEKQGIINKTGVAKYLEKQGANPATGVAKYMAKQIVKDREAAAARTTGVEKYLRNKG